LYEGALLILFVLLLANLIGTVYTDCGPLEYPEPQCTNTHHVEVTVAAAREVSRRHAKSRRKQHLTEWSIVTGAAGFIGSHVAEHCLSIGQNVVMIDDLSGGFVQNLPSDSGYRGTARFENGSITDDAFLERIFKRYGTDRNSIDFIYHLSAYAAVGLSHFIRNYNYDNNLVGSIKLINHAVNHKVKCFVYTSSIAIYGRGPHEEFSGQFTESTPAAPEDPYGISKYAVELDLEAAHELFGLNYVILRPHNVYGPNQNTFDKYRNVIGIFLYSLLHNQPMGVFGDGTQTRSFSYIDDVAPYISASPYFEHLRNKKFNIGAENPHSLHSMARTIIESFVYDNKMVRDLHRHSPLKVMTQFEGQSGPTRKDRDKVLDELMENEKILQHLDPRNEPMQSEADDTYFYCMFGIDEENTVSLKEGMRRTLEWILKTNYDQNTWDESTVFRPISFQSVEIAENVPKSWADDARSDSADGRIKITAMAQVHSR